MLQFYKMTGADNDFVMVDNRDLALSNVLSQGNVADICNRRFGVGADGLISVEPAQGAGEVRMRHYLADGSESGWNSSAAMCFSAFVDFLMDGDMPEFSFETSEGLVKAVVNDDDTVTIQSAGEMLTGSSLIVFRGEVIICEE